MLRFKPILSEAPSDNELTKQREREKERALALADRRVNVYLLALTFSSFIYIIIFAYLLISPCFSLFVIEIY